MNEQFSWGSDRIGFRFEWDAGSPVRIVRVRRGAEGFPVHPLPLVEITTADHGSRPAADRLVHTELGTLLRHVSHAESRTERGRVLTLRQAADGVEATVVLELLDDAEAAVRSRVEVRATGDRAVVLRSVASWSMGFTQPGPGDHLAGWERVHGVSDWFGEGRWTRSPLRGDDFPRLSTELAGKDHDPRGHWSITSDGTWSTGRHLPVAGLESAGLAFAWQIEHNGAWRWELGDDLGGAYFSLSGPTDADAAWTKILRPGESFTTVPVTVTAGADFTDAVASLTDFRRAARRPHVDNAAMPVVFNDYMNTLLGDPTTEKLLPLIGAAAEVGAEIFCIDAGWYDDSGDWWPTVGEWQPSTTRFPGGLGEVVDAIRDAGMVPGLWLEPEVIGVRSPMADTLPHEAFLQRHGQRLVEHHRYHLDLRHPAAVAHLDAVVDRLVHDFGVGFFKFDYNIDPGPGTDLDADSIGDGLLEHNRAHLAWLDGVLDRHPGLVVENCSSGAMRMDFAVLSRLAMQSTSDQQEFTKYPPIAAAAPISLLPEQAANWAYPQPGMNEEEAAFCLVTGLLGRFYVSGHLNAMTGAQRRTVAEAIAVAKTLRGPIANGHPHWPTGLPGWTDPWISLGLKAPDGDLVSVWRRGGPDATELRFPHLAGREVTVSTVFPADLPEWKTTWDAAAGVLTVAADAALAARTLRLTADA
ncbi:alpha-galactosidase [Glycomyces sp. TRM65418]|uniref:glycoside hydrolase family 36 protein n=1 Tax=Glycomyces sp. TRM65418 TaxID=2867006 RepID=UPI001CE70387|nr:glycoside hydrolase family 36 protein [Glycomyces sp. TRM65418]MCC3763399.1 alpha-galactosidase [Glycomyces sp. TRM65418]QZD57391.1 alpha-galactosidase [Glycomyces sp. TRM65418]